MIVFLALAMWRKKLEVKGKMGRKKKAKSHLFNFTRPPRQLPGEKKKLKKGRRGARVCGREIMRQAR